MRCAACGAALVPGAGWCGLCYAAATAAAPTYATAAAGHATTVAGPPPAWDAATARAAMSGASPVPTAPFVDVTPLPAPAPRSAGLTTFAAIGVGALMELAFWWFGRDADVENEALIRYGIVGTLAVYGIVTWLVVHRIARDGHPLRWRGSGGIVSSAALGLGVGAGAATLLLQAVKAAGSGGGDQGIALLVSEGSLPHVLAAFLIVCVAAPVVEELLFRGVLLASLLGRGRRRALWLSALAFAAWHLDPTALRYYSLAGALLGFLYLKRGLACSIAAHAAFNGTLLAVAVSYALSAGPVLVTEGLTVRAAPGWHQAEEAPYVHLLGPSGSELVVLPVPNDAAPDAREYLRRLQDGKLPMSAGFRPLVDTAYVAHLPAGDAVRVRIDADGRDGELVVLPTGERVYLLTFASGGSARARNDLNVMLDHLRLR